MTTTISNEFFPADMRSAYPGLRGTPHEALSMAKLAGSEVSDKPPKL